MRIGSLFSGYCESCKRVESHREQPRMGTQPSVKDRFTHARHLVRDNPPPPPMDDRPWTPRRGSPRRSHPNESRSDMDDNEYYPRHIATAKRLGMLRPGEEE